MFRLRTMKITDAIRDDLPYGVEWQECDLSRKQEDASFYALYPKLTGEIRNRDYLNEIIEKQALLYKNYCQMYVEQAGFDSCHIQCFGYVTNMDSEHLSVVFDQKFYLNNQSMPGLSAINIDVETGTILKKEQQFNYSTGRTIPQTVPKTERSGTVRKRVADGDAPEASFLGWRYFLLYAGRPGNRV